MSEGSNSVGGGSGTNGSGASAAERRTPLYERHVAAGAKMVPFAGFSMPVRYTSEKAEHLAVRQAAGLFDVSHMGEVFLEGPKALDAVQRLFSNDAAALPNGQAMYTGLLNERGTFVDDAIVYRFHEGRFLVCTNAGNRAKDTAWIEEVVARDVPVGVTVRDEGDQWAQLAVQGPNAVDLVVGIVGGGAGDEVRALGNYAFREGTLLTAAGERPALIARTGYTGEDGFELYVAADDAVALWDAVVEEGQKHQLALCGLACRDTLRLEAGMALYGNDIDDEHTPLEAGLGWTVKLDRPQAADFVGAEALRRQKKEGVKRRLRGLEMVGRGIPRHGYPVVTPSGEAIGTVTSGTHAPFLDRPIAMAYVADTYAAEGTEVAVDIRGKPVAARVVKLPFYRRPRK